MTKPKNILFLMTDHTNREALAPDSPCLTPNLNRIAARGTRFSRCYTTNAICSPARASLMTGLYPSTHGMWDCTHTQRKEWVDVPASRFTYFSQRLAEAGYHNGYFGKWHVEQSNKLENFGWHEYDFKQRPGGNERIPGENVTVPGEGYKDYDMAGINREAPNHPAFDNAINFLERHLEQERDKPFCCFVSTIEPHDAYVPPRKFYDLYKPDEIPLPETLRGETTGKPEVVKRMRSVWESMTDADWQKTRACYWAVISYIDSEIGRLMDYLREKGLEEDTIIIFTSDHGDMLGAHGLATKGIGTAYEEVYNIPLIISVPGQTPAEDTHTLTSLVDIAPTLLDCCGVDPLPEAQGQSLRPVLEGSADADDYQAAYAEFFGQRFVYTQRMVWHNNWKYVFSPGGLDELYNLEKDPHEKTNLAQDPAHQDQLKAMAKRMWQQMKDIGDNSLFNSQYATLRTAPIGPECLSE